MYVKMWQTQQTDKINSKSDWMQMHIDPPKQSKQRKKTFSSHTTDRQTDNKIDTVGFLFN